MHYETYCDTKRSNNKERSEVFAIVKGVSGDNMVSGTREMLDKIRNHWTGVALAAGVSLGAAFAPSGAAAQDAQTASVWTDELRAFDRAATAARGYAESYEGVGIVFHVGRDISGRPDAEAALEKVAGHFVAQFAQYDVKAQVFPSPNDDTQASGVTYHIGNQIHGSLERMEVKDLRQGLDAIPDAATQYKRLVELFAHLRSAPAAAPAGG